MENQEGVTAQEAIDQNPKLETVEISYYPGGGDGNHITVNGGSIGEIATGFSIDMHEVGVVPRVTIKLAALKLVYKGEGSVKMDGKDIPDDIARKMYQALKERFDPN